MLRLNREWFSWDLLRKTSIVLFILIGGSFLYLWHLGSLTPNLSISESLARQSTTSIHSILSNPIDAPQKLLQYGLQATGHHSVFWLRFPSVVLTIAFLGMFYFLVRVWFGRIIAILSTAMLAATPWVILLARSATADLLLLSPLALLASYVWLMRSGKKRREIGWLVLLVAACLSLYTPGIIWLVIGAGIVARQKLLGTARSLKQPFLIGSFFLILFLLLPLVWAIVADPSVGKHLLLWPDHWLGASESFKSIIWAGLALVWRSQYHIDLQIGRLPVLDTIQIALIIFGVYAMWTKARKQLYVLKGIILIGIIGAGLDHNLLLLALAIPSLAILVAAGLRYLYSEWRSVFPLNPIPKALAIVLMAMLVSLHIFFGVRYALVAWPHTIATHQAYMIK